MRMTPLSLVLASCSAVARAQVPELVLPERPPSAVTGSQLLEEIRGLTLPDREALLWRELASGNVPRFLRTFVPVTSRATVGGRPHEATFWCTPDYVGIGDDGDWFRMPMAPPLAQQLADRLDCALPTRRMVDLIWAQAPAKLTPFPFSPDRYDILSPDVFHLSHLEIERQFAGRTRGTLTAGIKKDVVASALIGSWPGRVVIYGWHYPSGKPIQPLWKGHTFGHVDYSHGIRLVARACEVDGRRTTVDAVLADPALNVLLSDEGPFTSWRYPASTERESRPTPAEQLDALIDTYWSEGAAMSRRVHDASTDEERAAREAEYDALLARFAGRFAEMAGRFEGTDAGATALTWVADLGWRSDGEAGDAARRAVAKLLADYLDSPALARLANRLTYVDGVLSPADCRAHLRTLIEKSPHRAVRAAATMHLCRVFLLPEQVDPDERTEAKALLAGLIERYADEPQAAEAKRWLYEIEHLQLGMVAPDFTATDQDGEQFELASYRGKIVVLFWWGFW